MERFCDLHLQNYFSDSLHRLSNYLSLGQAIINSSVYALGYVGAFWVIRSDLGGVHVILFCELRFKLSHPDPMYPRQGKNLSLYK